MKIIVTFELQNDVKDISRDELEDWLKYELGQMGHMFADNPLDDQDIKARNVKYDVVD